MSLLHPMLTTHNERRPSNSPRDKAVSLLPRKFSCILLCLYRPNNAELSSKSHTAWVSLDIVHVFRVFQRAVKLCLQSSLFKYNVSGMIKILK